jgi:hypothetical protein
MTQDEEMDLLRGALIRLLPMGEGVVVKLIDDQTYIVHNESGSEISLSLIKNQSGVFDNSGKISTLEDGKRIRMNLIDDIGMKN